MTISRPTMEKVGYGGAFALLAVQAAFLTWRLNFLIGTEAIYRTNVHTGITGFGPWWYMYTLPAVVLGFVVVNGILARVVWPKKEVHRTLLAAQVLLLALLSAAGVFVLVLMNIAYG